MHYRSIKTRQSAKERLSLAPYGWAIGIALVLVALHAANFSPKAIKCHTIAGARYALVGGCYKEVHTITYINLEKTR